MKLKIEILSPSNIAGLSRWTSGTGQGRETLDTPPIERCPEGSKSFRLKFTFNNPTRFE